MKNCKDFILKEKFSSKKIFLLESILNNLTADSKKNPQNLYKSEEPVKKKDFKTEIEARFFKAKNSKYIFPKQILVAEADENSSLDSLKNLGVYDLNLQNQKKNQESDNISTKKLIKNIQKIKIYEKKEDFCETLQKMKKSLQEKLKKQLYDKKYNNFVDENEIRYNDNKNSNASDRLEYKSNRKKTMPKNLRTSFSNLHSNFNHSLQQNAQNLDAFAKQNMCPTKINSKKSHMINFLELYNEKKKFFVIS